MWQEKRQFKVCNVDRDCELSGSFVPILAPFDADDKLIMRYYGLQFGFKMKCIGNDVYTNQYGKIRVKVDRNNVDEIYCRLNLIKQVFPELRTQQIMSMAAKRAGWKNDDLFYCEDTTLIKGLQMVIDEYKHKPSA